MNGEDLAHKTHLKEAFSKPVCIAGTLGVAAGVPYKGVQWAVSWQAVLFG